MYASTHWSHAAAPGEAWWAVGIGGGGAASRLVGCASCKPADALVSFDVESVSSYDAIYVNSKRVWCCVFRGLIA